MSINSQNSYNEYNEISESVNRIGSDISALREVTYSYIDLGNDTDFNTTIFSSFIGLGFGKKGTPEDNKEEVLNAINEAGGKEQFYLKIREKVEAKIDLYQEELAGNIDVIKQGNVENGETFIKVINNLSVALKFTKNALPAELEKSGIAHGMSEEEIKDCIAKQDEYDKELFGEKVINNLSYVEDTCSYLKFLLHKHGDALDDKKNTSLKKYIKVLEKQGFNISENFDGSKEFIDDGKYIDDYVKYLREYKINRDDYAEVFQLNFDIAGVPQEAKIGNYSYFYDSDEEFGIPNSEGYAVKSLEEIYRIPGHEATHYQNYQVTMGGDGIKLPGDMIKEEGLASAFEKLIQGIPLENMNYMSHGFPPVLMSNLLEGDEFEDFSDMYTDLLVMEGKISQKGNLNAFVNRKKRGYLKGYIGGTNKDASYTIGLYEVINYLKSKKPLPNLYGGKISMEDVESGDFLPDDFGNKFISPLLTAELIPFYMENREKIEKGNFHREFIEYVKRKYSFLEHYFDNFSETELFSKTQRLKLLRIIKKFEKSIKKGNKEKKKIIKED